MTGVLVLMFYVVLSYAAAVFIGRRLHKKDEICKEEAATLIMFAPLYLPVIGLYFGLRALRLWIGDYILDRE